MALRRSHTEVLVNTIIGSKCMNKTTDLNMHRTTMGGATIRQMLIRRIRGLRIEDWEDDAIIT
jgi:hypothetical protein